MNCHPDNRGSYSYCDIMQNYGFSLSFAQNFNQLYNTTPVNHTNSWHILTTCVFEIMQQELGVAMMRESEWLKH